MTTSDFGRNEACVKRLFIRTIFVVTYVLLGALLIGARQWFLLTFDDGAGIYADVFPQVFFILLAMWISCLPFLCLIGISYDVVATFWRDSNKNLP